MDERGDSLYETHTYTVCTNRHRMNREELGHTNQPSQEFFFFFPLAATLKKHHCRYGNSL